VTPVLRILFAPVLILAAAAATPVAAQADTVRIAVLAFQGSERAAQDFEPTLAHLNATLAPHHFELAALDPAGIELAVAEHTVDFVVTNPGDYVELEAGHGVTRLATLESRDHAVPTDTVGSTVITPNRAGHPTRFADLAGRRLAVVSPDAFGGWRVVWREMDQAGVPPERLQALVSTGFPMASVITALREGRADAGCCAPACWSRRSPPAGCGPTSSPWWPSSRPAAFPAGCPRACTRTGPSPAWPAPRRTWPRR
jgi:two-component system sensor histidine kinase TtrS